MSKLPYYIPWVDTSKNSGVSKPEQEKTVSITENGTSVVFPDAGQTISKVTVNVNVDDADNEIIQGIKFIQLDTASRPTIVDLTSIVCDGSESDEYLNSFLRTDSGQAFVCGIEEVYLPPRLSHISSYMFAGLNSLTTLHGVENIKTILYSAFYNCYDLQEVPNSENLTKIDSNAFGHCKNITNVSFSDKLQTLKSNSFYNCTGITNVTITKDWAIGLYFQSSSELTQESLHSMIENLADMTGQNAPYFNVGETNIAKIDEEHITMLETKNWNYS